MTDADDDSGDLVNNEVTNKLLALHIYCFIRITTQYLFSFFPLFFVITSNVYICLIITRDVLLYSYHHIGILIFQSPHVYVIIVLF